MKHILLYGDSNVWGDNFISGCRIPSENQWANILRKKLEGKYEIYQEGLPGRIAGNEDMDKPYKNGKDTFMAVFRTKAPVNVVIIALGTNDLQIKYDRNVEDIISDLLWYKEIIKVQYNDLEDRKKYFKDGKMPRIIYILPPNFDYKDRASIVLNENSEKKRKEIINYFSINKNDFETILFEDATLFEDGIHLNYDDHQKLATLVEGVFRNE